MSDIAKQSEQALERMLKSNRKYVAQSIKDFIRLCEARDLQVLKEFMLFLDLNDDGLEPCEVLKEIAIFELRKELKRRKEFLEFVHRPKQDSNK